ncbi:hypothetical protein ABHA37_08250 [Clostridium tertium]|uniref:BppU family phage baseplate upper protein n=1 Tax=Clostridium tertium TaxID=1559 RepID=UPI00232CC740|nr:hypothetical protein [Clostridium tertium]MDB1923404.1 hypothetical protein [Clostridium tertium]MDB1930009.1 hypothetical protein [Clostridium tertium]
MLNQSSRKIINVDSANLIPLYTFKQEDDAVLLLSLFKNSTPLDVTGQTVTLGIKRPNGTLVNLEDLEGDNPFTIDNNNLDIKIKNSVLAVPGLLECDLELVDVNGKMTTASFFITVNKKVVGDTNIKATNEIAILDKIKLEEEEREAKEGIRATNESDRINSENARVSNENTRIENENIRKSNEQTRVASEKERVINEESRKLKEAERVNNENLRVSNENTRKENETTRVIKEQERIKKETERVQNETNRANAENFRVSGENTRKDNEATRLNNEQERIGAEEQRKTKELARETAYKEIQDSRKDFNGKTRDSLSERLNSDMAYVSDRFNKASLLEYDSNYISANKSYDGVTKDLKVKGRTLQNLASESKTEYGTSGSGGGVSITKLSNGAKYIYINNTMNTFRTIRLRNLEMIKPSTKYTLFFNVVKDDFNLEKTVTISGNHDSYNGITVNRLIYTSYTTGLNIISFITGSDISQYTGLGFGFPSTKPTTPLNSEFIINNIVLLEGDYTNKPIPEYFEGIKSVGEDSNKVEVLSVEKNLFDFKQKPYILVSGVTDEKLSNGIKVKNTSSNSWAFSRYKIKLKPNTSYYLSRKMTRILSNNSYNGFIDIKDAITGIIIKSINGNEGVFGDKFITPNHGEVFITFIITGTTAELSEADFTDIQLEEGTVSTTYKDYKEDKISLTLAEPLRGLPNGVCDEIDLERGKIIRRVGKIVINSNTDIANGNPNTQVLTRMVRITLPRNGFPRGKFKPVICNSLPANASNNLWEDDLENVGLADWQTNILDFRILKTKLTSDTVEGAKQWLINNNTVVYYELETPIETSLDLLNNLRTYDNVTNITSQGSLIEPNIYCKTPSDVVTALDIRHSTVKNKLFGSADERIEELEQDFKRTSTQEAWISPTLLSGWVSVDNMIASYMKDSLGFVHIKGRLKSGGSYQLFNLPVGYRPIQEIGFLNSTNVNTPFRVIINNGGLVQAYGQGSNEIYLDGIVFRAEL